MSSAISMISSAVSTAVLQAQGIAQFPAPARWLLATLWHYQQQHFPAFDSPKRWTYGLPQGVAHSETFAEGFKRLKSTGLISMSPLPGHVYLSDIGMEFCRDNSEDLVKEVRYEFAR